MTEIYVLLLSRRGEFMKHLIELYKEVDEAVNNLTGEIFYEAYRRSVAPGNAGGTQYEKNSQSNKNYR